MSSSNFSSTPPPSAIESMLTACTENNLPLIQTLLSTHGPLLARLQSDTTGQSPLMAAAQSDHLHLCQLLMQEYGAPWNAVDRKYKCAGNYASEAGHQAVVDYLVEEAVKAELLLGSLTDSGLDNNQKVEQGPVDHQPCTKPDYLQHELRYTTDALLDNDNDAVMMEWERPLMELHASILSQQPPSTTTTTTTHDANTNTTTQQKSWSVLNIGFGMGIIDSIFQSQQIPPTRHVIVEAHPKVYQKAIQDGWNNKPGVTILHGKWQDVLPSLVEKGEASSFDAIFFDTYGEDYEAMRMFHAKYVTQFLTKPHGVYSYFNGLAPDNIFFHGVACQVVKLHLAQAGLDVDFLPCEIKINNSDDKWKDVRRKYWHLDTYYIPVCTWRKSEETQEKEEEQESNKKQKQEEAE